VRKPLYIASTILFLTIFAFPQAATADDQSDDDSGWEQFFDSGQDPSQDVIANRPPKPGDNPEHKHKKLEDQYGDVDHVGLPRIAIRPGVRPDPETFVLPIVPESVSPTSGVNTLGEIEDNSPAGTQEEAQEYVATQLGITFVSSSEKQQLVASKLNPSTSAPIQIRDLVLTNKTPADEFLDGAIIFGAGLGGLAFMLLGITGVSAIKLRREAREL
jgi:hypothetical protein